jgi:transglutaminase-like putative cysteine protease
MLLEMALHGIIIYDREDELSAKRFIYQETISKDDLLLDYSLVKTDKPIPHPRELKYLEVEISGLTEEDVVVSDEIQKAMRDGERVKYIVSSHVREEDQLTLPIENEKLKPYLKSSAFVQSDNREIIAQSQIMLKGEKSAFKAVKMLTDWVDKEIKDSMTDSFSSLDVLHKKEGECQAHAYLYAALARAAGIPTRVVSGLVYLEEYGFLYHSWAESYIGFWIPIDPTFGQVPADATHIKLVEGERFEDLSKLINVIGRLKAKVVKWE